MIFEKNLKQKISWHYPFNSVYGKRRGDTILGAQTF